MTLIVALEGQDGLVLAADSRGTIGDPRGLTAINDLQQKLFPLSTNCGITVSGSSELASYLIVKLQGAMQQKNLTNVDDIAQETVAVIKSEYFQWFGNRAWAAPQPIIDQRPSLLFLLAGYNNAKSPATPRIYLINSALDFAPQLCSTGFMVAGVPQYAIYLIHRLYDRAMNLGSLASLAAYLITETASQDPKVGGPVKIAELTPADGYKELDDARIQRILELNEEHNRKLREFFSKEVQK